MASGLTYRDAGVNLDVADQLAGRFAPLARRTFGPRVLRNEGGFAGLFRLDYDEKLFKRNYAEPVLVACTDGVGSKVLLAIKAKRFDTVGIDLVAMNVNDMLTCGAEPLFFLDYIAVSRLKADEAAALVSGVAAGCEQASCALLGGETAEMPALYRRGHFDLAGFAVGVVERHRLIEPRKRIRAGDVLIGLPSSGIHSNGYALVRKVFFDQQLRGLHDQPRSLGRPLIDALLEPTRIYVGAIIATLRKYRKQPPITGMAHITGGGLPGNVPRMLPDDCDAVIRLGSWSAPPIFDLLQGGGVAEDEMYQVFNMGLGMVLAVRPKSAGAVVRSLEKHGETPIVVGKIKRGRGRLELR